ncbi:MAG: tetratricopeptide repeat protein [Planctomycetota bacterium]
MSHPFVLAVLVAPLVVGDAADDLAYLAGLVERGLFRDAVPVGEGFLREHARDPGAPLARLYLAEALFGSERSLAALPHFESLAGLDGFEARDEARLRFAECCLAHERPADALAALTAITKRELVPDAERLAARAAFQARRLDEAVERYERLARATAAATRADAELGLAWCAFELERWDAVESHARRALEPPLAAQLDDALARELRQLAAEASLARGDAASALEFVRTLEDEGGAIDLVRGRAHAAEGRLAEAEGALVRAHARAGGDRKPRIARELGIVLVRASRPAEAVEFLRAANEPWWLARAQLDAGDAPAALATIERAGGDDAARFAHLAGEALTALGRTTEAEAAYARAETAEGLFAALALAFEGGRHEQATQLAKAVGTRFPDHPLAFEAQLLAGEVAFQKRDWAEAEACFAAALESTDPALARRARTRRLWTLAEREQHTALVELGRAHVADPEVALLVGRSLLALGDNAAAVACWNEGLTSAAGERALELAHHIGLETDGARARTLLARVAESEAAFAPDALLALATRQEANGDRQAARTSYVRFLERHAAHALADEARYGLAWLLFEDAEHERALQTLATVLAREEAPLADAANELAFWAALGCRRHDDAEETLLRAVAATDAADPGPVLGMLRAYVEAVRAEDGRRARAACDRVAARGGALGVGGNVERLWLELEAGDLDAADRVLEATAGSAAAAVSEAAYALGEANLAMERWEAAGHAFARAEHGERRAEARFQRAYLALRGGDAAAAARLLDELLAGEPAPSTALGAEALALAVRARAQLGDHAAVLRDTARFLEQHPRHAHRLDVLLARGRAQFATDDFESTATTLADVSRGLREGPRFAESELLRGLALLELRRSAPARAALGRALSAGGDDAHLARARLGTARLDEQEHGAEAALAGYLKVAILHVHEPSVTASLLAAGRLLEEADDVAGARGRYVELVERFPASAGARTARAAIARLDAAR